MLYAVSICRPFGCSIGHDAHVTFGHSTTASTTRGRVAFRRATRMQWAARRSANSTVVGAKCPLSWSNRWIFNEMSLCLGESRSCSGVKVRCHRDVPKLPNVPKNEGYSLDRDFGQNFGEKKGRFWAAGKGHVFDYKDIYYRFVRRANVQKLVLTNVSKNGLGT